MFFLSNLPSLGWGDVKGFCVGHLQQNISVTGVKSEGFFLPIFIPFFGHPLSLSGLHSRICCTFNKLSLEPTLLLEANGLLNLGYYVCPSQVSSSLDHMCFQLAFNSGTSVKVKCILPQTALIRTRKICSFSSLLLVFYFRVSLSFLFFSLGNNWDSDSDQHVSDSFSHYGIKGLFCKGSERFSPSHQNRN